MYAYLAQYPSIETLDRDGYAALRLGSHARSLLDEIVRLARIFFRQSETVKAKDRVPALHEGWQPFGSEFSISRDRPDLHESFWITRRHAASCAAAYAGAGRALHAKMFEYLEVVQALEADITTDLRRRLGLADTGGAPFQPALDADLQVLYYQPRQQQRELLQDQHEDGLFITLTWADRPGLEILGRNGYFEPLRAERGTLVVLPGEILSLLSDERIRPAIHRVRRYAEDVERFSVSYFAVPDIEDDIDIKPWISSPRNEGVSLKSRIRENRAKFLVH